MGLAISIEDDEVGFGEEQKEIIGSRNKTNNGSQKRKREEGILENESQTRNEDRGWTEIRDHGKNVKFVILENKSQTETYKSDKGIREENFCVDSGTSETGQKEEFILPNILEYPIMLEQYEKGKYRCNNVKSMHDWFLRGWKNFYNVKLDQATIDNLQKYFGNTELGKVKEENRYQEIYGDDDIDPLTLMRDSNTLELDLTDDNIDSEGARHIAEELKNNTTLTSLNLTVDESVTYIGPEGAKHIAEALKENTTLTSLYLIGHYIGHEGAGHIAKALKTNKTLTSLNLSDINMGEDGAKHIAEALKENTTLTSIDLSYNSDCSKHVAEALKENNTLTDLSLQGNKYVKEITELLKNNTTLTSLNLSGNEIEDDNAKEIAEALEINKTLKNLNLEENYIGDEGAEALRKITTLTTLNLRFNDFSE